MDTILVTGGAGFIGSAFVRMVRARNLARVVNLDLLTYAGNPDNLAVLANDRDHVFIRGDIRDGDLVAHLLDEHRPLAVVNFAAESHVDRSIADPSPFISTNVAGTHAILEAVRTHLPGLPSHESEAFRFLQVSTDEVFGSLGPDDRPFTEESPYAPRSPYAASKAAADLLVRAFGHTYGLPALVTNCSNNYGPRQFPDKLIPLAICNGLDGLGIPLYGDGLQVRDWLHVEDHCEGLLAALERGVPGGTWCFGGGSGPTNLEVVREVCRVLDEERPEGAPHERHIAHVDDRPAHDRRYALDFSKAHRELGWRPRTLFAEGIRATVKWYLENGSWVERARSGACRDRALEGSA